MRIGGRHFSTILGAPFRAENWRALIGMFRVYEKFPEAFSRYMFGTGTYPTTVNVRTPAGMLALDLHSRHDMLTVNEIFCRNDYPADSKLGVVADFGANIGISAAYFLSRNTTSFVHCYEPLRRNVERLHKNLERFSGRYLVHEVAVGTFNGPVKFMTEPTGRYGGIVTASSGDTVTTVVECRDVNNVLDEVLKGNGNIDLLKVDVENTEMELLNHIRPEIYSRIRAIYVECKDLSVPLPGFSFRKQGWVAQMIRMTQ